MKQTKLPGEIARVIKAVNNQLVDVKIITSAGVDEPIAFKVKREVYDQIMKSTLIKFDNTNQAEGDKIPSGFYINEFKTAKWFLIHECPLYLNDKTAIVNDRKFPITQPRKNHIYA